MGKERGDATEIPVDMIVLNSLHQFVKYSRLKLFALRALASTLNEEEFSDIKDQFDVVDVNKNGVISLEEMRHALAKDLPWKLKACHVLEVLQAEVEKDVRTLTNSETRAATISRGSRFMIYLMLDSLGYNRV